MSESGPKRRRLAFTVFVITALLLAGVGAFAAAPPDGWRIRFDARVSGLVDQGRLTIGASTGSVDGRDDYDDPHPPGLPRRALDLFTLHQDTEQGWDTQELPELRYRAQFDAAGPRSRMVDFIAETDQTATVTLTWAISPDLELAQHFLTLRDLVTGATVDMWAQTSYAFNASPGQRAFRIELQTGRSGPPIAYNQSVTTNEDTSLPVTLTAFDAEGDPLVFSIVTAPSRGTLLGVAPNVVYVPNANANGPDSFTFKANDGQNDSNIATVSLTVLPVNDPPSASGQSVTTNEDTAVAITLAASDVDGDPLTFSIATQPAHGTLSGAAPNLTYTPAADYNGPDVFSFRASDGQASSNAATVQITVNPVDDPPVADFTIAGPTRNVAHWYNNLASAQAGAFIVAATSGTAASAIDDNPSSAWLSSGKTNESFTVKLPGVGPRRIDRFRLVANTSNAPKRLEVWTSTDGVNFQRVLSDEALSNLRVQEFPLSGAVLGSFVKLVCLDNQGGTVIQVNSFEAVDSEVAGVPSYFAYPTNAALDSVGGTVEAFSSEAGSNVSATKVIDGSLGTLWRSASGQQVQGQFVTLRLSRGRTYPIDRIRVAGSTANTGVKQFHIEVSEDGGGSFTRAVSFATAPQSNALTEFPLGRTYQATHVRLVVETNYGGSQVDVRELEVPPIPTTATSVSSYDSAWVTPENLFDGVVGSYWRTPAGTTTGSVEVRLAHGESQLIDRVQLATPGNVNSLRDFEIYVSETTDDDASFTRVVQGTLQLNNVLQSFSLAPVRAKFVKLVGLNNYGGSQLDVSELQVDTVPSDGNIVSLSIPVTTVAKNESPAQIANGASVLSYSSATSSGTTPKEILDYSSNGYWQTTAVAGQFAIIQLAGGPHTLKGVQIAGWSGPHNEAVKDFEVWVSPDNTAGSYHQALAATALNNGTPQTFAFPAETNVGYVKYVPLTPASATATRIVTLFFDVLATDAGGVVDFSSQRSGLGNRPEQAFDGSAGTTWATASGSATNQFVTVRLPGAIAAPRKIYGVRIYGNGGVSPKDFEVRVSDDATSYATALTATYPSGGGYLEFDFRKVETARYVQFFFKNGYSSTIEVRELEVLPVPDVGAAIVGLVGETPPSPTGTNPMQALDLSFNTYWQTASPSNQSLKLLLPRDQPWLVDRVALQAVDSTHSPREFEVQVSMVSTDDADFLTVLSATLRRDGSMQDFFFPPTPARYVRLLLGNNYGGTVLQLRSFFVVSRDVGALSTRFIDRSSDVDGTIVAHSWLFGDGGVSAQRDPAHTFTAPGPYSVTLDVTGGDGTHASKTQSYLAIGPPTPSFTLAPATPDEGQSVTFTDTSTDAGGILLREWSFGDGTTASTTAGTVSHTYRDNASFPVTLTVTNIWGARASVTQTVPVANVAPVATASDQRWVAGQELRFSPQVRDAGSADTWTCVWDFGDGTVGAPSSNCTFIHTYASQPPDAPTVVYDATLTVTDDDGGVGVATAKVTIVPQKFQLLASGINNNIGIDWSPLVNKLVVTKGYSCCTQLVLVGLNGSVSAPIAPLLGGEESKVAVSTGLGGFNKGDVFLGNGERGEIVRVQMDATGTVTRIDNPWVKVGSNGLARGGLAFDDTGAFGYELITTWTDGKVFRTKADGSSLLVAKLPALEGADVVPPGAFGLSTGGVVAVDYSGKSLWAVRPNGTFFKVLELQDAGGQLEWPHFVPSPGDFFFNDFSASTVYRGDSRGFPTSLVGHLLVTTEFEGEVWDVYYDSVSATYKSQLHALAIVNGRRVHFEQTGFVPAVTSLNSILEPPTANLTVGSTHTVRATIKDSFGNPVPGLALTFTVTGANPTTGTGTTNASGVATFSYVGGNAGHDEIVASSLNATTNTVTADWRLIQNRPPVADDQSVTTDEDTPVAITLTASDPDGDPLTYTVLTQPAHGTLSGAAPNLTYSPATNYNGPDSFTFKANDGQADSNIATVSITVRPGNRPPVADDQLVPTDEDTAVAIVLTATDPDGDPLTFTVLTQPVHGTLSGTAPNLTYSPAANYNGPDSFTFRANDGQADSNVATVTITVRPVNDRPVAYDQPVATDEDVAVAITLTASDPDGDPLTYTVLTQPAHGTLSGTAPNLTYSPFADYNGPDSFTFKANDGQLDSNAATVTITVRPVNDAPVAYDQPVATDEDVPVAITLTASDVENDPLTFTVVTPPAHGTLSGTAPNLTYEPATNYHGPDSFTFKANDGQADSNVATVSITVRPVNDAPVAYDQPVATDEDVPVAIALTASDVENDPLTFTVLTQPANGTLSGTAPNLTYTPATNYNGPDSFTFKANDGQLDSNVATVTITVRPINDPPNCTGAQAVPAQLFWPPSHPFEAITIAGVTDPEGNPITITATSIRQDEPVLGPGSGNTSPDGILSPLQVRVERSGQGDGRIYHIGVQASDGNGGTCTATVKVCVPHDQGGNPQCIDQGPLYDSTQQ